MKRLAISLVACLWIVAPSRAQESTRAIRDCTPTEAMEMVRKAKGSVVVFHVYASWCRPCADEFPAIIRACERYKNHPCQMLAFSVDQSAADMQRFLTEKSWPLEGLRLTAPGGLGAACKSAGMGYDGRAIPYTAVIDASGQVVKQWTGSRDYRTFVGALDETFRAAAPVATEGKTPPPATASAAPPAGAPEPDKSVSAAPAKNAATIWPWLLGALLGTGLMATGLVVCLRLRGSQVALASANPDAPDTARLA